MIRGHVTLHGLDDDQLIILIKGKKSLPEFTFDPSKMKAKSPMEAEETNPKREIRYSDVTLAWVSGEGMKAVEVLLGRLYRRERLAPVS